MSEMSQEEQLAYFEKGSAERLVAIDATLEYAASLDVNNSEYQFLTAFPLVREVALREVISRQLTATEAPKRNAATMLLDGTYKGQRLDIPAWGGRKAHFREEWPSDGYYVFDAEMTIKNRLALAYLACADPETLDAIADSKLIALHGTGALALPGILTQQALLSEASQIERGLTTVTGEGAGRLGERNFVSFSVWNDGRTAFNYAEKGSFTEKEAAEFAELGMRFGEMAVKIKKALAELHSRGDLSEFEKAALIEPFGVTLGLSKSIWAAGYWPKPVSDSDIRSERGFADMSLRHISLLLTDQEKLPLVAELLKTYPESSHIKLLSKKPLESALCFADDWSHRYREELGIKTPR